VPWEQIEQEDSGPDGVEFSWESSDTDVPAKEFRLIDCQSCSQSLRVPTTHAGAVSCPKCLVKFSTENTVPKNKKKTGLFAVVIEYLMLEAFICILVLPFVFVLSLAN